MLRMYTSLCVSFDYSISTLILLMQFIDLSVFELNFQGYSDWTNAFTLDEWVEFNYKQDLKFFYCYG